MTRHKIILLLLAATALWSCAKDPVESPTRGNRSPIDFGITIAQGYPQAQMTTRGTPQVGATAYEQNKITVLALDQTSPEGSKKDLKIVLHKSGNSWLSDTVRYYDVLTYNFYAYASDLRPITTTENENGLWIGAATTENPVPKIYYSVPKAVTKQPDLLIGNKVENKATGQVSLSMYHALSCVGFVATSKHTGNIRKVKSVTLKNVYGAGFASIDKKSDEPIAWQTTGNKDLTFTAGMNGDQQLDDKLEDITNDLAYLMTDSGYLMMVPQTLPEGAKIVMEIWDGTNATSIHTINYDIPPTTWEPGRKYMYYFDEPVLEGAAAYYEKYTNGSLGLYYFNENKLESSLVDDQPIADAGYGLLVPASTYTQYPSIYLGLALPGDDPKDKSTSDGSIVASLQVVAGFTVDCVLYPLSQNLYPYRRAMTSRRGFQPAYIETALKIEAGVSETGSGKPINTRDYFLPHYAKGVYQTAEEPDQYTIRTPIQMRNISYQTDLEDGGLTVGKSYKQEFGTLDFSIHSGRSIYGKDVNDSYFYFESIVIGAFGGTYSPQANKASIAGLIIKTPENQNHDTALFEWVVTGGKISNIETAASCIYVCASTTTQQYVAGIAAVNSGTIEGVVNRAAITNNSNSDIRLGGVVGLNTHKMINCENYGVINNQSENTSSATGGVAAWNERYYPSWGSVGAGKAIFESLQYGDYTPAMEDTYPGALISNCKNHARVIGAARTGGIAGVNNFGGVIYACTNIAEIRNNGKLAEEILLGGIVGLQQCGFKNNPTTNPDKKNPPKFFSTIQNCVNTGNITATSGDFGGTNLAVGGIVGNNDFAEGTNGATNPDDGYNIEAYGRVNQCVVHDARISGYYSNTGGIAGMNSGSVNRSRCEEVIVGGVFGNGRLDQPNSAGGIVGTNNNYVGNCLFTHSSTTTSPISSVPVWGGSSASGGIVGINNAPSLTLKSESGYVQKCIFAAIAPANFPVGTEIGTFAPIAGWTAGYLYRDWKSQPHLQVSATEVDATTGATPLYTFDDNFYASGVGVNYTSGNIYFPNEPIIDNAIGPFTSGRYPYGQTRFSSTESEQGLLPLAEWFGSAWSPGTISRPPIVPQWYTSGYTLPGSGGTTYILGGIVKAIKDRNNSGIRGAAVFNPAAFGVANTVRVSLNYMTSTELANVTSIECDLSNVSFLPNNAGGTGALFFRAPNGWKFDASQTGHPKPYKMTVTKKNGEEPTIYYYCLMTETTGKKIKMIP